MVGLCAGSCKHAAHFATASRPFSMHVSVLLQLQLLVQRRAAAAATHGEVQLSFLNGYGAAEPSLPAVLVTCTAMTFTPAAEAAT
jgi:hypothetical protein